MSYVDSVLQPGETVTFRGDIHWKVYLPGLALLVIGIIWLVEMPRNTTGGIWRELVSVIIFAPALGLLFWAWFQRWTTEVAVTTKQVIFMQGYIRRHTFEMSLDKVESVEVSQTIMGRILNYGDILVRGTGDTHEPFKSIGAPLDFRNHVTAG